MHNCFSEISAKGKEELDRILPNAARRPPVLRPSSAVADASRHEELHTR